jgi:hypothetical protein
MLMQGKKKHSCDRCKVAIFSNNQS